MILKEKHTYVDDSVDYTLIDNVEKIEVGEDLGIPRRFIKIYKNNRKDPKEFEKLYVDENIVFVCNDQGKTLEKVVPLIKK